MSIKLGGLRLRVGFFAAAFTALLLDRGPWRLLALSGMAVLLHELTHLFCMRRCGCPHPTLEILPGGVMIRSEGFGALGYRQAAFCLASAPAVNLLTGGVLLLTVPEDAEWARFFGTANLALGIVNCLPLSFLDGGRTLECLLTAAVGTENVVRFRKLADPICLLLMAAVAAALTIRGARPLPYYAFCLYCLLTAAARHGKRRQLLKNMIDFS